MDDLQLPRNDAEQATFAEQMSALSSDERYAFILRATRQLRSKLDEMGVILDHRQLENDIESAAMTQALLARLCRASNA